MGRTPRAFRLAPLVPAQAKHHGPAGGTLVSADGKVTVTIPAGALASQTQVSVEPIAPNALPAVFANRTVQAAYDVSASTQPAMAFGFSYDDGGDALSEFHDGGDGTDSLITGVGTLLTDSLGFLASLDSTLAVVDVSTGKTMLSGPVTFRNSTAPRPLRGAPAQEYHAPIVVDWGDFAITLSKLPRTVQVFEVFAPLLKVEALLSAKFDAFVFQWGDASPHLVWTGDWPGVGGLSDAGEVEEHRIDDYYCQGGDNPHEFVGVLHATILRTDALADNGHYRAHESLALRTNITCTSEPPPPAGLVQEIVFTTAELANILHALGLSVDMGQDPAAATAAALADQVRSMAGNPLILLEYVLIEAPGSPVSTSSLPMDLAITPSGEFLYASTTFASELYGFSVNLADGSLASLTGSPFATSVGQYGLQISPDGQYLYAMAPYEAEIHVYAIATDGALSEIKGSPYPTVLGNRSNFGLMHPSGNYYYAPSVPPLYFGTTPITIFGVDKGTGELDSLATANMPYRRFHMVAHPNGKWIYATNSADNKVSAFAVDMMNGTLTEIHAALDSGDRPYIAAINDAGNLLAVTNGNDGTLSVFAIDQVSGGLTEVTNSPFAVEQYPFGVIMIPQPPPAR